MNISLNKSQTTAYLNSFKLVAQNKKLTSADMVVYAYIMNRPLDSMFKPISNKVKLNNGARSWKGLELAFCHLQSTISLDIFKDLGSGPSSRQADAELVRRVVDAAFLNAQSFLISVKK